MTVLGRLGQFWELAKAVEKLLAVERTHGEAIADIRQQLDLLDRRVERLEYRVDGVATEAKAAARAGAQDAMSGTIADISRRIGTLEAAPARRVGRKPKEG